MIMEDSARLKHLVLFSLTGDSPGVPVPEDAAEARATAKAPSHTYTRTNRGDVLFN